ncbi:MAG: phosphoribosylaminoimidazolesuccinocarboxamide synthase [Cyanobacteria bacterium P01_F01_bin.86]
MRPIKPIFYSTAIATNLLITVPVFANCADTVGSLEYFQPAMERHWQQLQTQTDYPWGAERPYGELMDDRIVLTAAFDTLEGNQKDQAIDLLWRAGNGGLHGLLTPEEKARPGLGALPPYRIFTHDGRLVHAAYDGCTPVQMLTERDRYDYYYNRLPYDFETGDQASFEDLRNAGQPFWRTVQFPIAAAEESAIRLSFWNAVGYAKVDQGWWIAWVPEQGHFEVNVSADYDPADLQRFWRVAPIDYRYVVVTTDGTWVLQRW